MNSLIKFLKKYGSISPETENELLKKIQLINKKKGDFFLKQGQVTSSLLIMEKGLIRAFFVKDDKEYNSWFAIENEIISSILPLYAGKPSFENIQFLEDSTGYWISVNDLNDLYRKHPELEKIGRKMAEELCIVLEERITSLHTESAEQRYQNLVKNQPHLLQRLNLGHIASFLGITQETLSRIRKR